MSTELRKNTLQFILIAAAIGIAISFTVDVILKFVAALAVVLLVACIPTVVDSVLKSENRQFVYSRKPYSDKD